MASKYNIFNTLDNIYNNKVKWTEADKRGDNEAKNAIAERTKRYYQELRDNNYHDVADEMNFADLGQAEKVRNYWGMAGKTAIRPYLSKLAGQYKDATGKKIDINDYLGYNEATGEVSLGGRNLGRPYSHVNGNTYWDPEQLQKEFKQFVSDIGASMSNEQAYDTTKMNGLNYIDESYKQQNKDYDAISGERSKVNDTYYKLYGENMNSNPFDTEWGKAIMQRYSLNGAKAANNAVASSVGSNGGNIDSYAAANAMRQNLAFESAGQAAVLDAFNSKMNNAYNILQGLGVNVDSMRTDADSRFNNGMTAAQMAGQENQRLFENNETMKNNNLARQVQIGELTGYTPTALMGSINPYLNADGTVSDIWMNDETGGLQTELDSLDKQIEEETDPLMKARLRLRRNMAAQARNQKIAQNMDKYGSLTPSYVEPMPTELGRSTDLGYYMTKDSIDAEAQAKNAEAQAGVLAANAEAQAKLTEASMNNASKERIAAMGIEAEMKKAETEEEAKKAEESSKKFDSITKELNSIINKEKGTENISYITKKEDGKYSLKADAKILDRTMLDYIDNVSIATDDERYEYLLALGYTDKQIEDATKLREGLKRKYTNG